MPSAFVSASLIVCESLSWEEERDLPSAIHILSAIKISPGDKTAHFFTLVQVVAEPFDNRQHTLAVQVAEKSGRVVARSAPYTFSYGYKVDPSSAGGFILGTEFEVVVELGFHWIEAMLDGKSVVKVPLILQAEN
jgi:hypothetical protein